MKLLKLMTNKIVIFGALILAQLGWLVSFWLWLSEYSMIIHALFMMTSILVVVYIISTDRNPSYKIGWIILIMTLPILGGFFYLFFGTKMPTNKLRSKIEAKHVAYLPYLPANAAIEEEIKKENDRMATTIYYLQNACLFPAYKNTQTKYYPLGDDAYPDMLAAMEKAEHYIFMEYFIIKPGKMWDGVYEILKKKAAAGLDIRLMYDDMGCLNQLPPHFMRDIRANGIKCLVYNPFVPFLSLAMNNRDHRKILVVDGHTAFSGGFNIADEYINAKEVFGHWKDTGIRLQGDAVWNFTVMFLEMWNAFCDTDQDIQAFRVDRYLEKPFESDGYVLPYGDTPLDDEATGKNIYVDILNQAKRYVYMFTPYLLYDSEMENALRFAAKRGVDVRLATPGIADKKLVNRVTRSNYKTLLAAGVKIYEYTPGFLHAKSYVSDDEIAVVGTINMDFRSLFLHFECGTYLYKTQSVMQVKEDFLETQKKCAELSEADLKQSIFHQLVDNIIRVFAPLL